MKNQGRKSFRRVVARFATVAAFALAASASLQAQQTPPSDPNRPTQDAFNRRDMRDREAALRIRAKSENKRAHALAPEQLLAQIKEDYERIQALNNEMRRAARVAGVLDYKRISSVSAEVKKRATRLEENLLFPEPEEEAKKQKDGAGFDTEQMKASLSSLDELIVSFVTNPVFQSNALDAQQATKAGRDLREIIELSAEIRKAAEQLNKARAKSQ